MASPVFFRHFTTGPDNFNNVLALAFGVLIVMRLIVASLWIMINEVALPRRSWSVRDGVLDQPTYVLGKPSA